MRPGAVSSAILTLALASCAGQPKTMHDDFDGKAAALLKSYAACLDTPHSPCADLFTDDGALNLAKGRAAVATQLDKESALSGAGTHRLAIITIAHQAPGRAEVVSDIDFSRTDAAGKWVECSTYRYFDEVVSENGALRFARRDTVPIRYRKNPGDEPEPTCETWQGVGEPGSFQVAAANLTARYGEMADMREMKSLANIFTEDASLSGLDETHETILIQGRDAIQAYMADRAGTATPGMHAQRFVVATQTGPNTGSAITYMTFFRRDASAIWRNRLAYRYDDTFRRVNGVWLISRRDATPLSSQQAEAEAAKAGAEPVSSEDQSARDAFDSAARALIAGYSRAVDTRDLTACKSLFAPDAELWSAYGDQHGRAEITCGLTSKISAIVGSHVVTNILAWMEGPDRGSAITDAAFFSRDDSGNWAATSHPRYFDQLVRIDGHWLIDHRENISVGR